MLEDKELLGLDTKPQKQDLIEEEVQEKIEIVIEEYVPKEPKETMANTK